MAGLHPEAGVARLALSPGRQNGGLTRSITGQGAAPSAQKEKTEPNGKAIAPAAMAATATGAAVASPPATDGASSPAQPIENGQPREFNTLAGSKLAPTTTNTTTDNIPVINEPTSQPDPEHIRNENDESHLPDTSRAGTYTVPYHDKEVASPPPDSRTGTSATRFEQQSGTHAEGQLEHGTPNTTVDGQGTSHTIIEPRTVGQAPKETPLVDETEPAPSMLEQAQQLAGQAVTQVSALPGVVMGAVGLGGKAEEKQEEAPKEKKEDSRVDELDDKVVEEFVRDMSMTKQQNKK